MPINGLSYALVSATVSGGVEGVAQPTGSAGQLPTYVPVWVASASRATYNHLPAGGQLRLSTCSGGSSAVLD